ncbi:MAG: L,D-transpeptidase family protein [Acidimicrobiales bacterium]|nr:L,D-transpeptidase family protein [Acidimicrobiales bacterium]
MRILRTTLIIATFAAVVAISLVVGARLGVDGQAAATGTTVPAAVTMSSIEATPTSLPPTTTTTAAPTTTTTTASPATPPVADGSLRPGDDSPEIVALQQRLSELGFWLGEPGGGYGRLTTQAVMAFQKANGLERDGIAGPATRAALATAGRPVPQSTADGIEIDLARQLLFVLDGGEVRWVLNTSTGAAGTRTPRGAFAVDSEIDGVRHAPLGNLYRPKYFNGGIAVHGSPSIPGYAASHGCARLSNSAMDLLWASGLVELGTAVRVV